MNTTPAPYTIDAHHRLHAGPDLPAVEQAETPNQGGMVIGPKVIVLHYTAGRDAAGSVRWLCQPQAKASAHLVVARGGKIWQLAAFSRQTWHAGVSAWRALTGLNRYAIGIEMANLGCVRDQDAHPAADYLEAHHKNEGSIRLWERYNAHQAETVALVCVALKRRYPTIEDIVGHDEIAPGRKLDPGPAWDWAAFRARVAALESAA